MINNDKPNPYLQGRIDYSLKLKILTERDYKLLDLYYTLSNKVNEDYDNGKLDLLQTIDANLVISREITIIHDRIRKRLNL